MRRITWLGHATALLEVAGARLLTDPVLRGRVAHLRRHTPTPGASVAVDPIDAVLISHAHHDHLDRPSLRPLARAETEAVVPRGAAPLLRGLDFGGVHELGAGETASVGGVEVEAVQAWHPTKRFPHRAEHDALGFLVERGWVGVSTSRCCRSGAGARRSGPAISIRPLRRARRRSSHRRS